MNDFSKQLKKAPIARTILFWKNFDRASPFYWVLVFAVLIFVVGIAVEFLRMLFWIGLLVLLVYLIPVGYWLYGKLK